PDSALLQSARPALEGCPAPAQRRGAATCGLSVLTARSFRARAPLWKAVPRQRSGAGQPPAASAS
ncbi:MAG: hypothetical protein IJT83_10365, partial [Victivallales bacterium]|nr:hypothetical protein [Victivallales bacterium]